MDANYLMRLIKNTDKIKSLKHKNVSQKVPILSGAIHAEIVPHVNGRFSVAVYKYGEEVKSLYIIKDSFTDAQDYCIWLIMEKDKLFKI